MIKTLESVSLGAITRFCNKQDCDALFPPSWWQLEIHSSHPVSLITCSAFGLWSSNVSSDCGKINVLTDEQKMGPVAITYLASTVTLSVSLVPIQAFLYLSEWFLLVQMNSLFPKSGVSSIA